MKGYITIEGHYYESSTGPYSGSDIQVPLRPSDTYNYDEKAQTWRNAHGNFEHNYPRATTHDSLQVDITEKRIFNLRDVAYILGILISAFGVYLGLASDLKEAKINLAILQKTVNDHQATSINDITECRQKIHDLELKDARRGQ